MYIIAGLGNPGLKYRHTRHNAGFDAIDVIAKRHGIT
ncbi:MAG: aminoacyl-tRNA hydrolase, partial [Lachnospiraceae bacterium]|nr:aminoacyl-tRNA hydrolase [Lachnospiraceae bacterium]